MNGNKGSFKFFLFEKFIKIINIFITKKKVIEPLKINKILIIKGDHIGDTIISTICLKPLKENFPNATVDVLCGSWGKETYKNQNRIDKIYILDHIFLNRGDEKKFKKMYRFIKQLKYLLPVLKKERYDVCILLRAQLRGNMALIANMIGPKYIVGFKGIGLEKVLSFSSEYNDLIHEKENFLNLLEVIPNFKLKTRKLKYEINFIQSFIEKEKIKKIFKNQRFNIILNYEGHDYNKKIPINKVIQYLKYYKNHDINIYIITPPKSNNIEILKNEIRNLRIRNTFILPEVSNLFYLLPYLEEVDLLVSVDTSIIHLGSIHEKKIIGIYYNNNEIINKFSPNVEENYIIKGSENSVRDINIEDVIKVTNKILKSYYLKKEIQYEIKDE